MITRFLDEPTPYRTTDDILSRSLRERGRVVRYGTIAAMVVLGIVWLWGEWSALGTMVTITLALFAVDHVFGRALVRAYGSRARLPRFVFCHAVLATAASACGGPLPMWFAMPYMAITYEDASLRRGWFVVLSTCAIYLAAAWIGGIALLQVAVFAGFAFCCRQLFDMRAQVMRSIVASLENQRDELAIAHSELGQMHEQLAEHVEARERMEGELRQAQKLEAVGRLAAGVAHEINTPMQFISNNLEFVAEGTAELLLLANQSGPHGDSDLGYLSEHLPTAVAEALQGVQRVTTIVRSMQQIVHPGVSDNAPIDVNTTILNALTLSAHEYNLVADVVTDLAPLPCVRINGGELTQVLINIIVNAAHAIADVSQRTAERGTIRVRSSADATTVAITIEDTGGGIPDAIRRKVFEPFFTTKPVGRGTGQGLSLARGIVERAGGELSFASVDGTGATFCVRLPIAAVEARRVA